MPKPVTMQQIADELGLTRVTVSYIINDHARQRGISPETSQRVKEYIVQRGYVPSHWARQLKNHVRGNIGIIYTGQLYSHLIQAFNQLTALYKEQPGNLELMLVAREHLTQGIQELLARRITKLVWIQVIERDFTDPVLFNYLSHLKTVVVYNYHFEPGDNSKDLIERGFHLVGVNRFAGMGKAARFLKSFGHTTVGLFTPHYQKAFSREGIAPVALSAELSPTDTPQAKGKALARSIRAGLDQGLTAVFISDDGEAACAMAELKKQGVRVPEDVSIIGYDGMFFGELISPPLTTLAVPVDGMVEYVKNVLSGKRMKQRCCLPLNLIRRESQASV